MMRLIPSLVCTLAIAAIAQADVVTDWNQTALEAIRTDKTPPPKAARALALLHTSIYDTVNGITQTHERYLVSGKPAGAALPEAAVSAAARLVLVRLFPAQQAAIDAFYNRAQAAIPNSVEKNGGTHWGEWVANVILIARSTDGAEDSTPYVAKNAPGEWQPTPPAAARPVLPQWPKLVCFAMTSGEQFRPPRMPAITSSVYAFELNLTKQMGGKESTARTSEQTAIAQFWADGPGTVTPPGHWNVIARDLAIQRGLTLAQNARLFALLNTAAADAGVLCWDCKYACNFWRPITAIQNADTDGNPATEKDPAWTPLLDTPPFPEYTSGHSTFSSAAATVLAAFFGSDEIPFSTTSEAFPGFSRTYKSFSEAASEAGMSRIFGGIHFMSANREGLATGARLGTYVVDNFLKPRPGTARIASSAAAPPSMVPVIPALPSANSPEAVPPPSPPAAVSRSTIRTIRAVGGQDTASGPTPPTAVAATLPTAGTE